MKLRLDLLEHLTEQEVLQEVLANNHRMVAIVTSLCEAADFKPGDRIKTFRGSARGVIVRMLSDGRVVWKADGSNSELIALPESLMRE